MTNSNAESELTKPRCALFAHAVFILATVMLRVETIVSAF